MTGDVLNQVYSLILTSRVSHKLKLTMKAKRDNVPTTIGDAIAKAPGFIISLKDADATIATHRA